MTVIYDKKRYQQYIALAYEVNERGDKKKKMTDKTVLLFPSDRAQSF